MTKGLENGIVGNLTFVSANNKIGHSFFVYKSYINDILDFSGFSYGYTWGDWKLIKANQYNIIANNYISIGNTAKGLDTDMSLLESSIDDDYAGIYFNREFAYSIYNYNNNKPQPYSSNLSLSVDITEQQLKSIINYMSQNNYYNIIENNCAIVTTIAWNLYIDDMPIQFPKISLTLTPRYVMNQMSQYDSAKYFDILSILEIDNE